MDVIGCSAELALLFLARRVGVLLASAVRFSLVSAQYYYQLYTGLWQASKSETYGCNGPSTSLYLDAGVTCLLGIANKPRST